MEKSNGKKRNKEQEILNESNEWQARKRGFASEVAND